jgi:hypothetical protein
MLAKLLAKLTRSQLDQGEKSDEQFFGKQSDRVTAQTRSNTAEFAHDVEVAWGEAEPYVFNDPLPD